MICCEWDTKLIQSNLHHISGRHFNPFLHPLGIKPLTLVLLAQCCTVWMSGASLKLCFY